MTGNQFGFKNLYVYQLSYQLALEIFLISKGFPSIEKYSLVDQIRRSSRSVCTNIAEAYRKRLYPKHFVSKLSDADGECSETGIWLDFAKDLGYLCSEDYLDLVTRYVNIGRMLGSMMKNPEKFLPRS
jgi:four helix bundle protein